ncbi:MAG: hypothetical protein OQK54_02520 [Gammaproteobacteria bacterium]|nr:hypothetical protein [Gammaproteobacteria bacterium]
MITLLLLATAVVLPATLYAATLPQQAEPPCMMMEMADGDEMVVDDCLQSSCDKCAVCSGCSHCGTAAALVAGTAGAAVVPATDFSHFSTRIRVLYPPTDTPPPRHS